MRRLLTVLTLVTALVATASGQLGSLPSALAQSTTAAPQIFPVPTVPGQQSPVVTQECTVGQVDINHTSATEIGTALSLPGPVAQRVIDHRPFLRPVELVAVAGIGPGGYDRIVAGGRACATPATLPPPAPDVCTSASQIDTNAPGAKDALASLFGRPTAERIIAAQPHLDLDNLVRVPGVGAGNLDKNRNRLCATPAPVDHAGTRWGWAYSATGAKISLQGATLAVPAGVINEPAGAWMSIEPLPAPPADLPGPAWTSFDFKVHGAWQGNGDRVYVTVPEPEYARRLVGPEWTPYLIHWTDRTRSTGEQVLGASVQVDPATRAVTGAIEHLSPVDWAMHKANWLLEPAYGALFGIKFPGPGCPNEPWDEVPGSNRWTRLGHDVYLTGSRLDLPGNEVPYSGFAIKHCVQTAPGFAAQTLLRNTTGTIMRLSDVGGEVTVGDDGEFNPDLIAYALTHFLTGQDTYLAPGADGTATVPAAAFGQVDMRSDPLRSVLNVGLDSLMGFLLDRWGPMLNSPTIRQRVVQVVECTYNGVKAIWGAVSPPILIREAAVALQGCFDYDTFYLSFTTEAQRMVDAGVISGSQADSLISSMLDLRELVRFLQVGKLLIGFTEPLAWEASAPITIEHYDAAPGFDDQGNIIGPGCTRRSGYSWVFDAECQARWLASLQPGGSNECVPMTGNPQCNASGGVPTDGNYGPNGPCDIFAGADGLQPAAPGCVLWNSQNYTWCGFGQCLPWPGAALKVIEMTDNRSYFVDANGGLWHLPTTDAYFSCANRFGVFRNRTQYHSEGKWYYSNLAHYTFMGDLGHC